MTAASEKISEERLRELRDMCTDPQPFLTETAKKPFTADIAIALDAYLSLRAEHEEMRVALKQARKWIVSVAVCDPRLSADGVLKGIDAAQGAARGNG